MSKVLQIAALAVVLSLASACTKNTNNAPAGGPEDAGSYQYSVILHETTMAAAHSGCLAIIKKDPKSKIVSENDSVITLHTEDGNYGVTLWHQQEGDGVRLRSKTSFVGKDMDEQREKARDWAEKVAVSLGYNPKKK